ncbi:MAG: HAD family hydrolase [Planctomycetota bacterium]|jgi:phosphoglycolate phosphatase
MPTQAVIFDLDGTLINSLDDIAGSANWALRRLGRPAHNLDTYRYYIGNGADVLMRRALGPDHEDLADEALGLFKGHYTDHAMDLTRPYPGVPAMLDALVKRKTPVAILTNKPQEATDAIVHALLAKWDWAVVHGHRAGVPKKPDPMSALNIVEQLGADPGECVFVGDARPDMETARAAGMVAVGCLWGFRDKQELLDYGAQHLIEKPNELVKLL